MRTPITDRGLRKLGRGSGRAAIDAISTIGATIPLAVGAATPLKAVVAIKPLRAGKSGLTGPAMTIEGSSSTVRVAMLLS